MKGHIILSHGLESGPDATKVSALAEVATALGFRSTRPDYRDIDARREPASIARRIARLRELVRPGERLILAGSSMGAYVSGFTSLEVECAGLFLLAVPIAIPGYGRPFAAAAVPTTLVHGWNDELCPVDATIAFAAARKNTLLLLDDDHRLGAHVALIADEFRRFLGQFG